MRQFIFEIPEKVKVEWDADAKAVVDTWSNYFINLDQFKEAVMDKGVSHGSANGVRAWIVDSSAAEGAFPQEIQEFIGSDCFPKFAEIGVKYFITITSEKSAITKMTVKSYSTKAGPNGLELLEVASVDDAIQWLKEN